MKKENKKSLSLAETILAESVNSNNKYLNLSTTSGSNATVAQLGRASASRADVLADVRVQNLNSDESPGGGVFQSSNKNFSIKKVKIKDIKAGQYVLSLDESTGKLVPRKVNALLDHGIKPIYEMTTEDGRAINTTAEHPYYVKLDNNYLSSDLDLSLLSCIDFFLSAINSESSWVLNTFMRDCCLNAVSSDHIAQFNANANAKYGSSLVSSACGDILLASAKNSLYASSGNGSTFFSSREKMNENASSLILPYFFILSFLPDNSLNTKLGLINLDPRAGNSSIIALLSESLLKNENKIEASTTRIFGNSGICTPYNPCLLATSLLSSEPHSNASSSVILEFFNNSSATLNINLSDNLSLSALDTIAFISSLASSLDPTSSSSEISTFNSGISASPKNNNENDYLKVSNDIPLGEWIEVRYLKVGDEIAVPDHSTGAIKWEKIASIRTLEPQHVYDLSIEGTRNFIANDIVAHNTYLATSSGNVGIGTTSPSEKLEVSGDVRLSGNLTSTNFNVNETSSAIVLSAVGSKRLIFTTDPSVWS